MGRRRGIPEGFHGRLLPSRLEAIEDVLVAAARRIPRFDTAGLKTIINGPDGYTPDGRALIGPVPSLRNFHVIAGFSIFGIVFGGAAGALAADWVLDGEPSEGPPRGAGRPALRRLRQRQELPHPEGHRRLQPRIRDRVPLPGAASRPAAEDIVAV